VSLGAGYRAYWGDDLTFDLRVLHAGWTGNLEGSMNLTSNGHNGYLDTWLELGVPGVIAIATLLAFAVWRYARLMQTERLLGQFYFALLVMLAIYSLANSMFFTASHLAFGLMLYPLFYLAIHKCDHAKKVFAC